MITLDVALSSQPIGSRGQWRATAPSEAAVDPGGTAPSVWVDLSPVVWVTVYGASTTLNGWTNVTVISIIGLSWHFPTQCGLPALLPYTVCAIIESSPLSDFSTYILRMDEVKLIRSQAGSVWKRWQFYFCTPWASLNYVSISVRGDRLQFFNGACLTGVHVPASKGLSRLCIII